MALAQNDKNAVGRYLLVQDKAGHFERSQLIIQQAKPAAFSGKLELKAKTGQVKAFANEKMTAGEASVLPFIVAADKIAGTGEKLWAEAASPSKDMRGTGFVLGVKGMEGAGDEVAVTAVGLKLDICQSRINKKDDPAPMAEDKKVNVGRFIHEQDANNHHGRALLVVRKITPAAFDGTLVLKGVKAANIELFPNERPTAGEAVTMLPHEFDLKKEKNEDKKFWIQGKTVSGALRDISLSLHLKEHPDTNADKVFLTVCKLSKLKADIPSTAPVNVRAGNAAARHNHEITGAAADHWDFDDAKNQAIVLIEDSVLAADPIKMSVVVTPAGVPIVWDTPRDVRPAPNGDHADVAALSRNPTIAADAGDPLKSELQANGVGTFHIVAFVDSNGNNHFNPTIDIEPYLVMNVVLVRVKGVENNSVKGTHAVLNPAAPTSATGCRVNSGGWAKNNAAAYSSAKVKVTGGGNDGRRGLDRVFAGWCQHIGPTGTSASVPPGLDIFARYRLDPPAPPPPLPPLLPLPAPAPVFRQQFFIFTQSGAMGTTFGPPPAAPPVVVACPVLDVTPAPPNGTGGDSCTGQWGGHGSFSPIVQTNKAIGQEWTVDTLDSPSVGFGAAHPHLAGSRMISFRFNIDFRVDLVFWTNITMVPTPTGDPANRLYSTVQTNNWNVRCSINFDPATGLPVGGVPPVTLTMTKDPQPTRRAIPVQGTGLETRFPIALDLFCTDATA